MVGQVPLQISLNGQQYGERYQGASNHDYSVPLFTLHNASVVQSVTPSSGPALGGTLLFIRGTDLQHGEVHRYRCRLGAHVVVASYDADADVVLCSTPAQPSLTFALHHTDTDAILEQANLSSELEALRGPIDDIDALIVRTTDPTQLALLTAQRSLLLAQLGADVGRLESGLSQTSGTVELLTDASIVITDPDMTAVVSRAAKVPTSPISTGWVQNLLIALAVGAVLGVGAALLRESLDTRFHSDDEISEILDTSVLGHVGKLKTTKHTGLIVNQPAPDNAALEAFRKIRSSVTFLRATGGLDVIQVTSPVASNGKTTVSTNLAVSFVQQRQSVLVIDADMRRPRIHKEFLVNGLDKGLSAILAENLPFGDAIRQDLTSGVYIIPAGQIPPNPSELLTSDACGLLIKQVRADFDLIIIDTPPLLPVPDARLVSAEVDGVILVADTRTSSKRELKDSAKFLDQAGAKLCGVVLNRVSERSNSYGHSYGYSYEEK